jgi:hypothetical protein
VLPGEQQGQPSIGCFLLDPQQASGALPPLRLIGAERNLADATITEDSEAPERTRGRTLRLSDGTVTNFETRAVDLGIGGSRPAVPADLTPLRLLPPSDAQREDPEAATRARARRSGYAYKLASSVVPGCYAAVLTPYQKVRIECGSTPYSGDWLLTKVVHRITPSVWTQHFEAMGDASRVVRGARGAAATGGGLSVSFSASVGVF